MITTNNITHQYPSSQITLTFPDLQCSAGQALLITGVSGSGKTTLLSVLGGLMKSTTGEVFINNDSIYQKSGHQLDLFRGKNIGLVLQQHHFIESISVLNNLLLAQKLGGKKSNPALAKELLNEFQLGELSNQLPGKLSVGQRQRLGIARALVNEPALILADEPTSSLDDDNCSRIISRLKQEAETRNAALIVVTHDQRLKQEFLNVIDL